MKRRTLAILAFGVSALFGAVAQAESLKSCGSYRIRYYVLDGFSPSSTTVATGTVGGNVTDHRTSNVIHAVCEYDAASFEVGKGIRISTALSTSSLNELYSVVKSAYPYTRVGTAWVDTYAPYASGGGQASTLYWSCYSAPTYRMQRSAIFHTGLDTTAINADSNAKETEYVARVRRLLAIVARQHMAAECKELSYSTFLSYTWAGFALHSDLYEVISGGDMK